MRPTVKRHDWRGQAAVQRFCDGQVVAVSAIVLAVALIVLGLALDARAIAGNPYWRNSTDFGNYERAAREVANGENPYVHRDEFFGVSVGHIYPPPFALALSVPLALIGPEALRWVWSGLTAAALGATLLLLFRSFGPPVPWRWTLLAIGIVGLSKLSRSEIYHGQADLPLLLIETLGLWCLWRQRPLAAGTLLATTTVVKPFLGIFALWLIWRGSRRAGIAFVVAAGLLFAVTMLALGPSTPAIFSGWREAVGQLSKPEYLGFRDNHSLIGLLTRLFVETPFSRPWIVSPLGLLAVEIVVAIVLFLVFAAAVPARPRREPVAATDGRVLLVEAGVALGLAMALGPLMEGAHELFFLPAIVGAIRLAFDPDAAVRRSWRWAGVAWGIAAIEMVSPVPTLLSQDLNLPPTPPEGLAILATWRLGAVFLLAVLVSARTLAACRSGESIVPLLLRFRPERSIQREA